MSESSKFPKSWHFETPILKLAMCPLNLLTISSLNDQLSLDRLYNNRKTYHNPPNSAFWGWLSIHNPEFRNTPENFYPWEWKEGVKSCMLPYFSWSCTIVNIPSSDKITVTVALFMYIFGAETNNLYPWKDRICYCRTKSNSFTYPLLSTTPRKQPFINRYQAKYFPL